MKTPREFIKEIKPNAGNLSHIITNGEINGILLIDIEKAMKEYGRQWIHETASAVALAYKNGDPPANATFEMFNKIDAQ